MGNDDKSMGWTEFGFRFEIYNVWITYHASTSPHGWKSLTTKQQKADRQFQNRL